MRSVLARLGMTGTCLTRDPDATTLVSTASPGRIPMPVFMAEVGRGKVPLVLHRIFGRHGMERLGRNERYRQGGKEETMPIGEYYRHPYRQAFEQRRPFGEWDAAGTCPTCGGEVAKVPSVFASNEADSVTVPHGPAYRVQQSGPERSKPTSSPASRTVLTTRRAPPSQPPASAAPATPDALNRREAGYGSLRYRPIRARKSSSSKGLVIAPSAPMAAARCSASGRAEKSSTGACGPANCR